MPFVTRDASGAIVALHAERTDQETEEVSLESPEVARFLKSHGATSMIRERLLESDLGMVRVIEDLVDLLIAKRIIVLTDLPKATQEKLARRRDLRGKLGDLGGLVGTAEEILLP